ncbi:hypothetical protein ALP79_102551 [Pseudomonas savastanoi pv. fraxini]|nr:hypothetical protein PSYMP_22468 [Pseudomonas amygdali pv. morsprunorum str. M302280]KUG45157.1 hypothetical protein ALP79_102551 [Pseudomonas savastanoi pv. fraxini]
MDKNGLLDCDQELISFGTGLMCAEIPGLQLEVQLIAELAKAYTLLP